MASIRIVACWLTVGMCLFAGVSRAAPVEDPEALIRQGIELRRKGDDVRAQGYFARAYDMAKTPRSAAQLGLVELALGSYPEAEGHLSEALATTDAWVRSNHQALERALASAHGHLLRVELASLPTGATVATDGASFRAPTEGVLWLPPGEVELQVRAPGYVAKSLTAKGAAGDKIKLDAAMTPTAPPVAAVEQAAVESEPSTAPPPAPTPVATEVDRSRGRPLRVAGIAVAGAGVVVDLIGGVILAEASSKKKSIESEANSGTPYDASNGNWQTLQHAGVGLLVGGGAMVVGGAVLYLVGQNLSVSEAKSVSLDVGPGYGYVRLGGAF
jgi:hypothetical protein